MSNSIFATKELELACHQYIHDNYGQIPYVSLLSGQLAQFLPDTCDLIGTSFMVGGELYEFRIEGKDVYRIWYTTSNDVPASYWDSVVALDLDAVHLIENDSISVLLKVNSDTLIVPSEDAE